MDRVRASEARDAGSIPAGSTPTKKYRVLLGIFCVDGGTSRNRSPIEIFCERSKTKNPIGVLKL